MPTLIAKLRDELRHRAGLTYDWDRMDDLLGRYEAAPVGSERERQAGREIALLCERVADHLDASWLCRLTTALSADEERAHAAEFRTGSVYVGP